MNMQIRTPDHDVPVAVHVRKWLTISPPNATDGVPRKFQHVMSIQISSGHWMSHSMRLP